MVGWLDNFFICRVYMLYTVQKKGKWQTSQIEWIFEAAHNVRVTTHQATQLSTMNQEETQQSIGNSAKCGI